MSARTIAIITARGGSKRIPRKNIKAFLGKPIMEYSIEAALSSGIFSEVMVSTDDHEIAEIAKAAGAKVPFIRSSQTSSDTATTAEVLLEVLDQYKSTNQNFDFGCCIYPTAPFVTGQKLQQAFKQLIDLDADALIPVTQFSFPIWRSFNISNGLIAYNWPENAAKRSQDLPQAYHDCGQFYFFNIEKFRQQKSLVTSNTTALVVPESEVQDIDTFEDWKIAEIKYSLFIGKP